MRAPRCAAILIVLVAGIARADEKPATGAPPTGAPPTGAPATGDAAPRPEAAAPERDGFSFGSNPDATVEGGIDLFVATFKSRSHFGFQEKTGSRNGEVAFVKDLGWPKSALIPGVRLQLDLGSVGFLCEELQAWSVSDEQGTIQRERTTNGVLLEPGDTTHSHGTVIWSNLTYGYEVRYRFFPASGWPVDVYAAPTLTFATLDLDVRLRRVTPSPSNELGGHALTWAFAIGARMGVELFDHFPIGFEVCELPGPLGVASPRVRLWERIHAFVGARFFGVEATVGYKLQASHIQGADRGADMRFTGLDFSLGVRF